jgi:PAS domain S-box-containing protein
MSNEEARLKAVVDTAVDGVILIDAVGVVLMFNPACERLFGYRAEDVVGANVKMLMPAPFRDEHDAYIRNYRESGQRRVIGIGREVVGQRKDGTTFPIDLSIGEANQDGEAIFVGMIHDLTERKRTEEQLVQAQKMEAVGQLSGGIAHDFNNLLTVIIGNADTLSEALATRPDLQHLAEDIARAGEHGAELTQRLLAFSRRQTLKSANIDCNKLIKTILILLQRTLRENVEIVASLDPHLRIVSADSAQLESALLNLSLNAQDAMPDGGRLTITTSNTLLDEPDRHRHAEPPPGEYVIISVADNGNGMPSHVRERVFEPFFTTKDVGRGSGLGLSMVYGFVKQSNGHVSIESEPALGTTVRLYLPAVAAAADAIDAAAAAAAPAETGSQSASLHPSGHETVLVVEDDALVRSYAITCIEALGYRAVAARDGAQALRRHAEVAEIGVLFTDIVMPGEINGLQLAERMRAVNPGLHVIFTSGYAVETLGMNGRLPEGALFLDKPYRKRDVAKRLREVLST